MLMVQMHNNSPLTNRFVEQNHNIQVECKEVGDGIAGLGQELSEEDESRINEDDKDVNDGSMGVVQNQAHARDAVQQLQPQPQGPLVHWERFLPFQSLKVLLVENDDSTRHVVSALLRNCGYEVIAVSNGLQAWKILQDLTNHVDLVLTEVVMPCFSGIGLLSKIMSHKTCRNIPVIMMSSHDSMNIVFKCLSKGAVDFLAKPIRKNELKNLWQHVWRKCHSVSGSGSESAVGTQKSSESKSADESDNNTGSNDEDDIGSVGLNARDGSDNGSGTQSSWTKRASEVDSPKPISPWGELADPPDSTCAQFIHSRPEASGSNWVPGTTSKEHEEQDDVHENVVMGKDLEIGVPIIPNLQLNNPSEKLLNDMAGINGEKLPEIKSNQSCEQIVKGKLKLNSDKCNAELRNQDDDLKGAVADITDTQIVSAVFDTPDGLSPKKKNEIISENMEMPSLELSLKSLSDIKDTRTCAHDQHVLRHSDLSAFSRYNSALTASQAPAGNVDGCLPLDNSSEAVKAESTLNLQSNSNSTPPNQCSNVSSNNNDMGSTTNNVVIKPLSGTDKPGSKPTVKCIHPSSAFQPLQNDHFAIPKPEIQDKGDAAANTVSVQAKGMNEQVQVQHHHHHHHHHHYHHLHNLHHQQLASHGDLSLKNMAAAAAQCGSSNMLSAAVEGNAGNYCLNGSASGSDHGSNGLNGSSFALNPRGTNTHSENVVAGEGRTDGGTGSGSRTTVGQYRLALREAALNKFRQKRKDRCFEKKVRYQSRKKLAEQRPRVRGQFVRQGAHEHKDENAHS